MIGNVDTFWLSKNPLLRAIRRRISVYPTLYIPFRKMRMADTVVNADTHLLIEGFPRSGNTWTEALVREAGQDRLNLAHHAHAAAHVLRAMALGVPSVILFRDPDDAVVSLLTLYENQLDARGAYLEYVRFYKTIWPLRGGKIRIYSFDDVTKRPACVIDDLNTHFGLELRRDGLDSDDGHGRVFSRMDEKARRLRRNRTGQSKSRPDSQMEDKQARRIAAREAITAPKAQSARTEAYRVFEVMRSDLDAGDGAQ